MKKEIEYVNGNMNELKGIILDLKEQVRVVKSEYAKYADLTESKREIDVIFWMIAFLLKYKRKQWRGDFMI